MTGRPTPVSITAMFARNAFTRPWPTLHALALVVTVLGLDAPRLGAQPAIVPGAFDQQVARPVVGPAGTGATSAVRSRGDDLLTIRGGVVWRRSGDAWAQVPGLSPGARHLARTAEAVVVAGETWLAEIAASGLRLVDLPAGTTIVAVADGLPLRVLSRESLLTRETSGWRREPAPAGVISLAQDQSGQLVAATATSVLARQVDGTWTPIVMRNDVEGWQPAAVTAVAFDARGRLWVASPQGVAVRDSVWRFIDGARGLPVVGVTAMATGPDGGMWCATSRGAMRIAADATLDAEYRQGRRWLPGDVVADVAVDDTGTAWFATDAGLGGIATTRTTLQAKAERYESAIASHHRRTPYGYVIEAHLARPGDVASATVEDSDNDGLWTAMYGAAQAFAYAATGSEAARTRAKRAFEALRFLFNVTQGGPYPAPPGFPARSILPGDGRDPNDHDSVARDKERRATVDARWKVIEPRWPRSADGQWYWKSDTSSDELDGHYFFYALYHDLVAQDATEQATVAAVVRSMTDHLLAHDFTLVDHDGLPTRWGVFGPKAINHDPRWIEERGLNSLSMLTYLRIAAHVTGDARYDAIARTLVVEHGYAMNLLQPKVTAGVGGGNQSDDEMAFMNYYHLLKYEQDPEVRQAVARSLHGYWQLERPERNPFFNLVAAVSLEGLSYDDAFGTTRLDLPREEWLDDTLDTLRRFPVDLVDWGLTNSHRLDLRPLPAHVRGDDGPAVGLRVDGKVLRVDERMVFHWNHDPYRFDSAGTGGRLADGASYLLPYWMARFHRVLLDD